MCEKVKHHQMRGVLICCSLPGLDFAVLYQEFYFAVLCQGWIFHLGSCYSEEARHELLSEMSIIIKKLEFLH